MREKRIERICVFCGSGSGRRESYAESARALARGMAARGMGLVYGGGSVGLMGVVADTMIGLGREVVGVIPRGLAAREVAHRDLTRLQVVETMHERKAIMAELADAFIALPGGFGTFEELFEVITWSQLGIHRKPIGLLNVDGYYDALVGLVDHAIAEEFIHPRLRQLIVVAPQVETLLDRLARYQPPEGLRQWIDLEES